IFPIFKCTSKLQPIVQLPTYFLLLVFITQNIREFNPDESINERNLLPLQPNFMMVSFLRQLLQQRTTKIKPTQKILDFIFLVCKIMSNLNIEFIQSFGLVISTAVSKEQRESTLNFQEKVFRY